MIRKNIAGQFVDVQLIAVADGSAVISGSTSVFIAADGGAQAGAAGAVTHKGNGCWQYALTQGETNHTHIALTFVNAAAITVTVNVYPVAFDPTNATDLGVTKIVNIDATVSSRSTYAGADTSGTTSLLARLTSQRATNLDNLDAAVSSRAASGQDSAGTTTLLSRLSAQRGTNLDSLDASISSVKTNTDTIPTVASNVTAVKTKTDNLPSDPADESVLETAINSAKNTMVIAMGSVQSHLDSTCATYAVDNYHAQVGFTRDQANTRDEYLVQWTKNGLPVAVTSPSIVVTLETSANLIDSTAMTAVGPTGACKLIAVTNKRQTTGQPVIVTVTATIDGSPRTWQGPLGRDSA